MKSLFRFSSFMMSLGILVGFVACLFLYYGATMLLMVPGYPGEEYFAKDRIVYGVIPAAVGSALVLLSSWLWSRASGVEFWLCAKRVIRWLIGLVMGLLVILIVIARFRQN